MLFFDDLISQVILQDLSELLKIQLRMCGGVEIKVYGRKQTNQQKGFKIVTALIS